MRKRVITALSILSVVSITAASGQGQTRLPEGRYIYLDSDPNSSAPKALTIAPDGSVIWQDASAVKPEPSASKGDMHWQGDSLNGQPSTTNGRTSPATSPVKSGRSYTKR